MRIIGGEYKSRIFKPGKNFKARPTTDFARENLFNILNNRFEFSTLKILDLFGGTGSISFEFASRGCSDVTIVEMDYIHHSFICSVINDLKANNEIHPIKADVFKYLRRTNEKFDIIFADPPYDLKRLSELPDLVVNSTILANSTSVFILEHGKTNNFAMHPKFVELRVYGSVHFSFFST